MLAHFGYGGQNRPAVLGLSEPPTSVVTGNVDLPVKTEEIAKISINQSSVAGFANISYAARSRAKLARKKAVLTSALPGNKLETPFRLAW